MVGPEQMAPPQGGGLPPEIAGLLGGGAPQGGAPAPSGPQDSAGYVQELLALIDEWRQAEQDPEDLLALEKISTMLQQISTGRAKEAQSAMQGKLSPRILSQAYGG